MKNIFWFVSALVFVSCKTYHRNSTHQNVSMSSISQGAKLAKVYCQSCHQLPEPSLLDTKSWEKGVLPQMGPRLGIFAYGFNVYPVVHDKNLHNFYPSQPEMSNSEWQNIIDYYVATSPDSLPRQQKKIEIKEGLRLFTTEFPPSSYTNAATCYVNIANGDSEHTVITSDALKQKLFFYNKNLLLTDSVANAGPVVNIDFENDNLLACNIGILNPNNGKFGKGELLNKNAKGNYFKDSTDVIDSLQRPVQITAADFNKDGKPDYLVCEFGFLTGSLSWYEGEGKGHFVKHILRNITGAIKAYVQDYNHDGLPDIWVLFAQGDEGIFLYTNKGNGSFEETRVLQFPPSYGSSYFELDDFNKDGYPDILYTCGDNADYSRVLKPYHGMYIFMNDGANHFAQKYFYPINGCYKAIAKDFDNDGDLDIATISFFADYKNEPQESFVYFKNNGDLNFQPYSIPEAIKGRWLTMNAGDIDHDGKTDLILGNFSIGPPVIKGGIDWKEQPPFIIFKNTGDIN